jgi:hypothetical protein
VTPIRDKKLLYNSQLKHVGVANVAISVKIREMKLPKNACKNLQKIPPQVVFWVGIFFYADPDPTFRFDDDLDPDPFPRFTHAAKTKKLRNFIR